jgi:TRAP transporter TAXI family solute receptor
MCTSYGMRLSIATAAMVCIAGTAAAQTVTLGTLPQGSLAYSIGSTVAKVIGDKTDLNTRAVGFGGSNIYYPQLNQGRVEMSTGTIIDATFAYKGTGIFKGKPHPNLRILTRLFTFKVGFMVRKDSKIHSLRGFKGKRFPAGYTSQRLVDTLVRASFATEGMTYADVKPVMVPNFIRGTDAMVAGRAAGSFLAVGSAVVRKANAAVGIRFLNLKNTPEGLAKMQGIAPGTFFTVVKPSKRMPYITKPVTIIGFGFMILINANVSDEVAYKAAKALHSNKKSLVAGHGVFNAFRPGQMAKKGLAVPYHPGAIRLYKEVGQWPPK